ncbi:type VI secretion system accessory protein TagJ [Xanthobacter sp. DSM 24535]|uniref:type VI secretion system accessory protein TagJ n=1 Tax=Roseixanthobacter psychrophilus TaxID=3119917 RepID=UPI003727A59C
MTLSALKIFEAGRLADAIAAANEEVKAAPQDIQRRSQLAEFLCISGDLERAERQFDAIATQDPTTAVRVAALRQLVRADMARRQVWTEGRMPEFAGTPPEHVTLRLEALMHLRAGRAAEAGACLARAEEARPVVSGTHNGVAFEDFRDLDDLTAGIFEVLTVTGKYFWIPLEQVEEAVFTVPARPLDSAWRTVQMSVRGGPEGEVVVPATYPHLSGTLREALRLGRETDWVEDAGGFVSGQGLRCFLVGEDSVSVLDMRDLQFTQAVSAQREAPAA